MSKMELYDLEHKLVREMSDNEVEELMEHYKKYKKIKDENEKSAYLFKIGPGLSQLILGIEKMDETKKFIEFYRESVGDSSLAERAPIGYFLPYINIKRVNRKLKKESN